MNNAIINDCWKGAPRWASKFIRTRSGKFIFSDGVYFMGSCNNPIKHGTVIDTLHCGHEIRAFNWDDCEVLSSRDVNEKIGDL